MRTKIAIVGVTGYGGGEAARLLLRRPDIEIVAATSSRLAGKTLREGCAWLDSDLVLSEFDPGVDADVFLLCQESGFAMEHAPKLLDKGKRIIDFSADFRLNDLDAFRAYYKKEHTSFDVKGVYGLPELGDRSAIASARLVANPGCHVTAAALALAPLVEAGIVTGIPVVDSKSGVSGAGRARKESDFLFSELDGGFRAYAVTGHRHTPELEQVVGTMVRFTPHLVPMPRGIHSTIYVPVSAGSKEEIRSIWREQYGNEPFVRLVEAPPSTKQVLGTNRCDLWADYDGRTGHAILISVLDNLGKGAAHQAIQSLNIMIGAPETTGLPTDAVWP